MSATLLVELCGMRTSFPSRGHKEVCRIGADSDVISRFIKAFASRQHGIAPGNDLRACHGHVIGGGHGEVTALPTVMRTRH